MRTLLRCRCLRWSGQKKHEDQTPIPHGETVIKRSNDGFGLQSRKVCNLDNASKHHYGQAQKTEIERFGYRDQEIGLQTALKKWDCVLERNGIVKIDKIILHYVHFV